MDKWSELRTVIYVAKHGTVSAAAAALGYHRATVNRHIDALEAEIGARIFTRHAHGYSLTDVGEDVLGVATKTQVLANDLVERVRSQTLGVEGEIRVTLLAPFAGLVMSAVDEFSTRYPECVVSIDAREALVRLEQGEAHVAVRAGRKPDHPDYVVQSLGRARVNLYAHESYVARYGLPTDTNDLKGHRFVLPQDSERRLPFWSWIERHLKPEMIAMLSDDIWVSVEAISQGVGIGILADHEAQARADLHAVLPMDWSWSVRLWLTTHMDLHRTQKVQAMTNGIKAAFKNDR